MLRSLLAFIVYVAPWSALVVAGPVVHLHLAEQLFDTYPELLTPQEQVAFVAGTLFPDIRYIGAAARCDTHYDTMTWAEVLSEPDPFTCGMKFHSWVDLMREAFVIEEDIYVQLMTAFPDLPSDHLHTFLKFLEDESVFYPYNFTSWYWLAAIKTHNPYPRLWIEQIGERTLSSWHHLLSLALTIPPTTIIFSLSAGQLGFMKIPKKTLTQWQHTFRAATTHPMVQKYLTQLFIHLKGLLATPTAVYKRQEIE